jgi:plastocyanin
MPAVDVQRAHLLVAAGAAAALTGCGEQPRPTVIERNPITLEMRDYRFKPQTVRARAGDVRIAVVNRGRLPHALQLRVDGRERLRIPTVLPGRRDSASARLPAGRYRFACPIGNHEELGMHGVLILR